MESRTVRACDVVGLVDWAEQKIRASVTHIITLDFDRESVRSVLANNAFVAFLFQARSNREFRKYIRGLTEFIAGYAPGGLGLTIGFISAQRAASKMSLCVVFDSYDGFTMPSNDDEDDEEDDDDEDA
jgi:hypothetical protein